jgi:CubicO group peptidase (beta-lactamase class C family)
MPYRAAPCCAGVSRRAAICAALVLLAACGAESPSSPSSPPGGNTGLDAAYAAARQEQNLTSLVVSQGGAIAREEYFNGTSRETTQNAWSVTKSVLSLSVGLALAEGCLRSLDQTLADLLDPAVTGDPQKAAITLRHLLTMSSGLDFPEMATYTSSPSIYSQWINAPDQVAWVMARPLTAAPGQRFEYGSGTIHLASVALTRACGIPTSAFAASRLFAPLGIPARVWETDRQGYNNGGAGLELAPRDMLAIGEMVLNGGRYQGQQVVPAAWIDEMIRTHITTSAGGPTPGYGYAWWTGQAAGHTYALANGWGGQFIMVVPAKRLVVTSAARTSGLASATAMAQWQRIFDIITLRIVPAMP